ncbi:MAG: DUF1566 domain-containing protein [Planctomycetota bacterium]
MHRQTMINSGKSAQATEAGSRSKKLKSVLSYCIAMYRNALGWSGIILMTAATGFWAFWGTIEAFHEGWCRPDLSERLMQTLFYLLPSLVLGSMSAICIASPRSGSIVCFLSSAALLAWVIFEQATFSWFILLTLIGIPFLFGLLFWFGEVKPKRWAFLISIGLPFLLIIACGIEPVIRVSNRFDDGERGLRNIEGNGVTLVWAPAGPGWSRDGKVTWQDATERVRFLSEDGSQLMEQPQNIWRLPTRKEIVCSLTRANANAGGHWDTSVENANYRMTPDKESPIWDPLAPLIYLWTSESASDDRAWIVVYHGGVYAKPKNMGSPSLGFRAVRPPSD